MISSNPRRARPIHWRRIARVIAAVPLVGVLSLTHAQFDDILVAAKKYQKRAYESGEPQKAMAAFLAARRSK